jgi:hypothetical protein
MQHCDDKGGAFFVTLTYGFVGAAVMTVVRYLLMGGHL